MRYLSDITNICLQIHYIMHLRAKEGITTGLTSNKIYVQYVCDFHLRCHSNEWCLIELKITIFCKICHLVPFCAQTHPSMQSNKKFKSLSQFLITESLRNSRFLLFDELICHFLKICLQRNGRAWGAGNEHKTSLRAIAEVWAIFHVDIVCLTISLLLSI